MTNIKAETPWFLYIIETKHHQLYTGITLDWERRINEHKNNNKKSAKALRGKGPLLLKYVVKLSNKSDALKAELWVKKNNKTIKQKIIEGNVDIPFQHEKVPFLT